MSARAQTIDAWLGTHAAHQPDKIALHFEGRSWSYAALARWAEELATGLHRHRGIKRGDRIALLGHNAPAQIALFFGAARLGAMVAPLNWRLAVDELRYILADTDARILIHGPECAEMAAAISGATGTAMMCAETELPDLASLEPAPPGGAFSDPFLIVYTSGTTGRPKGAVLSQEAVMWNALASLHAHDFTTKDHVLNLLPLFHVGGINIQVMPCFFIGGTVTLHAGFDPARALAALAEDGITTTVCVPTMMRALMQHPDWPEAEFPELRLLTTGSTDVPVDVLQAVNDRGIPMIQVYGATETGPIATYQRAEEAASTIGSIGRPAAHSQVRVCRPDGSDCADDEPGELWVKGPNNFSHYWRNPEATNDALQDGWFRTGDVARRESSGLFWFVSRLKHVIISGGENIYPVEIERIVTLIPGVLEAAVVGRPDPRWGEVPVVVAAVAGDGPTRTEILAACDGPIARYKRPKDAILIDELPKNALGKVLLEDVRRLAAERAVATAGDVA